MLKDITLSYIFCRNGFRRTEITSDNIWKWVEIGNFNSFSEILRFFKRLQKIISTRGMYNKLWEKVMHECKVQTKHERCFSCLDSSSIKETNIILKSENSIVWLRIETVLIESNQKYYDGW